MPVTIKVNGTVNSLVHKGSNAISMATIPDVCKTPSPGGPIPIPYPNISQSSTLAKGTTTVKADGGMMIAIKGSEFSMSNGDEPGVAGGVKSSTFMKESTWILYSFDVKIEGQGACRLSDKKFQNHENTADLMGAVVVPTVVDPLVVSELNRIANCCNLAVDCNAANYKKKGKKRGCTSRGTKKHTCCDKAIKKSQANNDKLKSVASEWPDKAKKPFCRLDVRLPPPKAKVTHIFDFKFNCDPIEPYMSDAQKEKYKKKYKVTPKIIGAQGLSKESLGDSKKCTGATQTDQCA